jgi:hypothetical protein
VTVPKKWFCTLIKHCKLRYHHSQKLYFWWNYGCDHIFFLFFINIFERWCRDRWPKLFRRESTFFPTEWFIQTCYCFERKKSCCCFNTHSEMFALHVVPKYIHMCSIESKTSIWVFTLITRSYVLRFKCVLSFPQK